MEKGVDVSGERKEETTVLLGGSPHLVSGL